MRFFSCWVGVYWHGEQKGCKCFLLNMHALINIYFQLLTLPLLYCFKWLPLAIWISVMHKLLTSLVIFIMILVWSASAFGDQNSNSKDVRSAILKRRYQGSILRALNIPFVQVSILLWLIVKSNLIGYKHLRNIFFLKKKYYHPTSPLF